MSLKFEHSKIDKNNNDKEQKSIEFGGVGEHFRAKVALGMLLRVDVSFEASFVRESLLADATKRMRR